MAGTIALTNCGQILTMSGRRIVENGTILISDGKIVTVEQGGPPPDVEPIDMMGLVITPGLIDSHTHTVFAGSRAHEYEMRCTGATYERIAAEGGGILSTVKAVRETDEEILKAEGLNWIGIMLAHGTTTLEVKSGYGLDLESELKMLRAIKSLDSESPATVKATFLGAHSVPPEFKGRKDDYLNHVLTDMIPEVSQLNLATSADMFVEQNYFDAEDATRLARTAREFGLDLRLHVDQLTDGEGAELAARLGAKTADHLEQTGSKGIKAMANAGTIPVLLPGSVFGLGLNKYPDARAMLDAGLPVVLATDFNPGSSPTPSLQMAMSLACVHMGMTPYEAFEACTCNAAQALGMESKIGKIEPGYQADLAVWGATDYREVPYFFGINHTVSVMKNGEFIVLD